MKLTILIIPEAEAEIKEAYQWYEKRSEGLGNDFLLCMEEALTKILRNPGVHPVVHRDTPSINSSFPVWSFLSNERR